MFGLRLKELRNEKRISQQALSLKLNISQATVSSYENSERTPDINTLLIISRFFNVSLDYLTGNSDIKYILKGDFSAEEMNLIYQYRKLSQLKKEKLQSYALGLSVKP